MRLQKRTDIALRALIFLADSGGATPSEIAEAHGISSSYLMKTMGELSATGWIHAARGRGARATLAMHPAKIRVGDVVRTFERSELAECFRDPQLCVLSGACRLEGALHRAEAAFYAELDGLSLADLRTERSAQLLQLP